MRGAMRERGKGGGERGEGGGEDGEEERRGVKGGKREEGGREEGRGGSGAVFRGPGGVATFAWLKRCGKEGALLKLEDLVTLQVH